MKYKLSIGLLLMAGILLLVQTPTVAQSSDDLKRIEAALLTTPDKCAALCIWNFQVGRQTLADFRQYQIDLMPQKANLELDEASEGFYVDGIALHITPMEELKLSTVVDYLYRDC